MTSWINMCWVIGGLFSTGVLTGLMKNTSQWGYRIPFALQWIWPVPIIIVTLLAPESPWWLIRQGRVEDARTAIAKLTTPQEGIEFDLDAHVEMMVVTDQFEKEVSAGTNYWHLFRGSDLHRTEVSAMAFITQALCGVPFMGFGTQFFRSVGLSQDDAFHLTIGQDCLGLVGCFIAWWIMTNFGRRKMYLTGLSVITLILLIVGFIGLAPKSNDKASLAGGVMIILMIFCFQVGPVSVYVNHMLTNLAFYRTHLLYTSRRNPQLSPPCQDGRPVACQLQQHRLCYEHDHAEDGRCERLELGCEGRVLLGWYCSFVHRLGIFPTPRDQGAHILRVGSALRAQGLIAQVHSRERRGLEACVGRHRYAEGEAGRCRARRVARIRLTKTCRSTCIHQFFA